MMDRKELERMTKDEIEEYAEEEHGVELSTDNLKDEMIDQLLEEVESGKEGEEKMSSTKAFAVTALVVVGLFAAIIIGHQILTQGDQRTYNDFHFRKDGMLWKTQVQKGQQPYTIPFYYPPWDLEGIVSDPEAEQLLLKASKRNLNKTVFVTLAPDLESKAVIAAVEIARITGSRYDMLNLETHGALTSKPENRTADAQNPIVTCEQANNQTIVIWLRLSDTNVIHKQGNCIILEGTSEEDLLRVSDKFAYKLIGVFN